ncbi:MAG: hypothetical protein AABY14_01165, partial [Nanoarchaeota archaeon]
MIIDLAGFSIDESRVNNATNSNMTNLDENSNFKSQVGGQGLNITGAWLDITRFIPSAANYKFGRIRLPALTPKYYYCNGTFINPTCYKIENCSAAITNPDYINYTNHESYIPVSSGCYREISGLVYLYVDKFSSVLSVDDTTPPNITFNTPFMNFNASDTTPFINLSFADAGVGINNATISINLSNVNYTNSANMTCYNRSNPTQLNPVNATNVECIFNATAITNLATVNMTVSVSDTTGNNRIDSIIFSVDNVAPTYTIWNLTNGTSPLDNNAFFVGLSPAGNHTSIIQGATIYAFANFTDATNRVENVYLQVQNSSAGGWTTVFPIRNVTGNGLMANISYTFSSLYDSYQSGGNVSFRVFANDSAGNLNTSLTNITIQVNDSIAPNIQVRINGASDNRSNISGTSFTIHWNVTDTNPIQEINVSLDAVTADAGSCNDFKRFGTQSSAELNRNKTFTVFPTADCGLALTNVSHFVTVRARDSWGNIQTTFLNFTVDNSQPGITLNTPVNGTNVTSYTAIIITASEALPGTGIKTSVYTSTCNSTNNTFTTNVFIYPFNVSGCKGNNAQKTLTIVVEDFTGNTNRTTLTFRVDDVTPSLTMNQPTNASIWSGNVTINWTVSDAFNEVNTLGYYLDSDATLYDLTTYLPATKGNNTNATTQNISVGSHTIKLFANDSLGNAL